MSQPSSSEGHLEETELIGAVTHKALDLLAEWVRQESQFVPQGDNATIRDPDFAVYCQPLFNNISKQKNTPRRSSNVIRVRSPITFHHTDADLVPLRIISGTPTIGGKRVVIGRTVHITQGTEVTPCLDLLSLFSPDSEPSVRSELQTVREESQTRTETGSSTSRSLSTDSQSAQ